MIRDCELKRTSFTREDRRENTALRDEIKQTLKLIDTEGVARSMNTKRSLTTANFILSLSS